VIDAGLGAPSHAAEAMEMGADAVLVNTAIAVAADPNRMAIAFKMAVEAGRAAFESGLGSAFEIASPTSPLTAFLNTPVRAGVEGLGSSFDGGELKPDRTL